MFKKIYNDGIPEEIYKYILQNQYQDHDSNVFASVTELLKPTKIFWLARRHQNEIEVPASTLQSSAFGTMLHDAMEKLYRENPEYLVEERMYKVIPTMYGTYIITGKADKFKIDDGILTDYKETSVYGIMKGSKEDGWEKQQNIYAYMLSTGFVNKTIMGKLISNDNIDNIKEKESHVMKVKKLQIMFKGKDWRSWEEKRKKSYPKPADYIQLRLMTKVEQKIMIKKLIEDKLQYSQTSDDSIPACSQKERWQDYTKYAVYKKSSRKRALRVLSSKKAAKNYIRKSKHSAEDLLIEPRIGEPTRCKHWCYYSKYCDWYKKFKLEHQET